MTYFFVYFYLVLNFCIYASLVLYLSMLPLLSIFVEQEGDKLSSYIDFRILKSIVFFFKGFDCVCELW